jgi:asparagine synthase (glutamine-hydrolysing)
MVGSHPPENPISLGHELSDSVRCHFLSDVPVSVFLSAGLDSATILATSAALFPAGSLNSLTLGFAECAGTEADETADASHLARYYEIPHREQIIARNDFMSESERFFQAMDQPSVDGINTYFVSKFAHETGFKVALSGLGGDELFAGYPSFHEIPRLVNALQKFPVSKKLGSVLRRWSEPLVKIVTSPKFAGTLEYGGSVEGAYLLRRALFMPWELHRVLDQDLAASGLETLLDSENDQQDLDQIRDLPIRTQVGFLESTRYMRNQLLRDADWAGMAHSIEIRTPFVDFFLLRHLAPLLRSASPPGKRDMATILSKPLPETTLHRKKTGFFVPVREWMMDAIDHRPERGLRSWAKFVYRRQWPAAQF